jgi:hypothetical protein
LPAFRLPSSFVKEEKSKGEGEEWRRVSPVRTSPGIKLRR